MRTTHTGPAQRVVQPVAINGQTAGGEVRPQLVSESRIQSARYADGFSVLRHPLDFNFRAIHTSAARFPQTRPRENGANLPPPRSEHTETGLRGERRGHLHVRRRGILPGMPLFRKTAADERSQGSLHRHNGFTGRRGVAHTKRPVRFPETPGTLRGGQEIKGGLRFRNQQHPRRSGVEAVQQTALHGFPSDNRTSRSGRASRLRPTQIPRQKIAVLIRTEGGGRHIMRLPNDGKTFRIIQHFRFAPVKTADERIIR